MSTDPNVRQLAEFVRKHFEPTLLPAVRGTEQSTPILVLPEGLRAISMKPLLDVYLPRPERRTGTAMLLRLESFVDHVRRFADSDSVVFAEVTDTASRLVAVLDYHRRGATADPQWGEHRAEYQFPLSEEWIAWTRVSGKQLTQGELAEYLEDRLMDVLDTESVGEAGHKLASTLGCDLASPARLLSLARGLKVAIESSLRQATNLATGEAQLQFEESHNARGDAGELVRVPGAFAVGIPVFVAGELYQLPVRLRYRASAGKITFTLLVHRADRVLRHAIDAACTKVTEATSLPLLHGTPETATQS